MSAYTEMNGDVQYHIPNCPAPLILRAIKRSVRDFFTEALAHREYLATITVTAGNDTYTLTAPAGTEIVQVLNVRLDGKGMNAISESLLDGRGVDWSTQTGTPTDYFLPQRDQIRIYPKPVAGGQLQVRVALRPTRAATDVDTEVFDRYYEEIIDGALAQLFILDNTPWEDADQATVYAARFAAAIQKARLEVHNDDQPKLRAVAYGGI